ncbi:MAG: homoserine kinase [Thermoanaerobaculia bacterium]|jgi:homoserine kinase|nr:homoserine kinase [Thermoanaerobaculia bacterium]
MKAAAFAPGSIGNVGPGFDVLGLAIEGIGDRVTVELTDGGARVDDITGVDATLVPRDPQRNAASIAAIAWLRAHGDARNPIMIIDKGLPLSGGLGGSAASSVAGAFAAALAMGSDTTPIALAAAALAGEMTVAGEHLDNIAPSILGGLALSRSVRPIDIIALKVAADWRLALVTPDVRIQTKAAREVLPSTSGRAVWVQQMANTAGVVHAFATGDGELLRRALDDRYAEPRRAALIPHFNAVKRAAIDAGAFACTISGSGPTLVAICADDDIAHRVTGAMQAAFEQVRSIARVSPIAKQGVRAV